MERCGQLTSRTVRRGVRCECRCLGFVVASGLTALGCLLDTSDVHADADERALSAKALKELSMEELLDMEVTSVSKRPEKLTNAAASIQVITSDDIRRSGAKSVPEALRLAPNLEVAQINARDWAISARGFSARTANKLLVLIDGRTVYTPLFAGVFWEAQDVLLEDIERIEVISGPGATLWGANAVNGVINLVTKSTANTQGTLITAGAGTELKNFARIRYGGARGDDAHFRFYAKGFNRDSTELTSRVSARDEWHMGQAGFRADWNTAADGLLTVQGDVYEGELEQLAHDDISLSGGNILGRWSRQLAEGSELQIQMYYDYTYRRMPGSIGEVLHTYDADLQHRFEAFAGHHIVWGLGYRLIDDAVRNTPTIAFLPPKISRQWFTGFIQDEMPILDEKLHLTVGTKVEHNDYTGFEVQPSVRLAWLLNKNQTLWSALSRAVRTPSRIDQDLFVAPTIIGGTGFESETLLSYELGYRVQAQRRFSVSAAAFYNDYDDLRSLERIDPISPFPMRIGNGLEGESYGLELSADWSIHRRWQLRAGYTGLRIHLRPKPGSTDMSGGSSESHDPDEFWSVRSMHDFGDDWRFDLLYRHVSQIANQNVPAYGDLHARLAWQPTARLEASLTAQHLLDHEHAEFGLPNMRRQIERSFYGEITLRF
jgi:iron complex outermembrane recepter protein